MEMEGLGVARLCVQQGRILTRPHASLDHDDPSTQELPMDERFQYRHIRDYDEERASTEHTIVEKAPSPSWFSWKIRSGRSWVTFLLIRFRFATTIPWFT